jgi:hypothetical protein
MFYTQMASTGPSKMTQWLSWVSEDTYPRMTELASPSLQAWVRGSNLPYSYSMLMALGLMILESTFWK